MNKELGNLENLMSILAYRSKSIDKIVQAAVKQRKSTKNIFYEKPKFRKQLAKSANTLESMLASNNKLGEVFSALEKDVLKIKELDELNNQFEMIQDVLVSLDNLVQINDFNEALSDLSHLSDKISKGKMGKLAGRVS